MPDNSVLLHDDKSRNQTIGDHGRRNWLYPAETKGVFKNYRRAVAYFLFIIYLGLPWVRFQGLPLLQFDVLDFKLIAFGQIFWPQELKIFFPLMMGTIILLIAVTATYGRIWCGWACPQTIFLQFFFGDIERMIEGKSFKRKKRDQAGFSSDWLWRKIVKHSLFFLFSAIIANTFIAYFWGMDNVLNAIQKSPTENTFAFSVMIIDCLVFYFIFSFFKEQACIVVCPYAKFQSVLMDTRSLTITYDETRGENRGRPSKKNPKSDLGDCVDCKQCVRVCPTGIDIRDGQQLECIGCALCIDACDQIMDAWKKPKGLIRYSSLEQLKDRAKTILKPRFYLYSTLCGILFAIFAFAVATRNDFMVNVTKNQGIPYTVKNTMIKNEFKMRLRNKTNEVQRVKVLLQAGYDFNLKGNTIALPPFGLVELPLVVNVPQIVFEKGKKEIHLQLKSKDDVQEFNATLIGPFTVGN